MQEPIRIKVRWSDGEEVVADEYGFDAWSALRFAVDQMAGKEPRSNPVTLIVAGSPGEVERMTATSSLGSKEPIDLGKLGELGNAQGFSYLNH